MTQADNAQATQNAAQGAANNEQITGRSVFLVETTAAGIAVQTALLTNDSRLLRAPAVFPDVEYAFAQIEELKRLVSRHFSEAARVGAQLVAAQQQQNGQTASSSTDPDILSSAAASASDATPVNKPAVKASAKPVAKAPASKAKR